MIRGWLHAPEPEELIDFLREHLRCGDCVVQVAGECEVVYHGRAASMADAGDYLVMLKSDGSLQVHGYRGVKPVNWQPQTDDVRIDVEDGRALLVAERFTPAETVRIAFLEPAMALALHLREGSGFVLMGTEAQMQRALARDPDLIEEGLEVLERELPTDAGGIDLFARDRAGALVVVELKRGRATQEAVHQVDRYVRSVRAANPGEAVRGVLAAPEITKPALSKLEGLGLEFREVLALPVEEEDPQGSLFG